VTQPVDAHAGALALLSNEAIANLHKETHLARGLPNAAFTSDEFLNLENDLLFPRTWMYCGRASAVVNAGDILPVRVAGRPLILMRGSDGELRVFHNVCLHRGALLVDQAQQGKAVLTCPYHQWSYGLDGNLRGRPHFDGHGKHDSAGSDANESVCLFGVATGMWHDWVFVNLDGRAQPFEDFIAPANEAYRDWDLSQFRFARHESFAFRCNWKLALENFIDAYHVFAVHPALDEAYVEETRSTATPGGPHAFTINELAGPGRGLTIDPDGPDLPTLKGLRQDLGSCQPSCNLVPNITMVISPGNLQFVTFEPDGPEQCTMNMSFYFVADAAEEAEHEEARQLVYAEWASLNVEDEDVCRRMQEGRACDAYDGGRLSPYWDLATIHFHRQIADILLDC